MAKAASLNVQSYDADEQLIKVIGKGNKERAVFPDSGALVPIHRPGPQISFFG